MYNLGYDIGSSTVKIALVDAKTNHEINVLTHPKEEMPIYAAQSGWAEKILSYGGLIFVKAPKKYFLKIKYRAKKF